MNKKLILKSFICHKEFITVMLLLASSVSIAYVGSCSVDYSNNIDVNLIGRTHYIYFGINNDTREPFEVYDFHFKYDFTTNNGIIYFKLPGSYNITNINMLFVPGININKEDIVCDKDINVDHFNYSTGRLLINTKNKGLIYDNVNRNHMYEYTIKFNSNWTPTGTYNFINPISNTTIHYLPGTDSKYSNIELVLGNKYQVNSYDKNFKGIVESYKSNSSNIQAYFPPLVNNFHGIIEIDTIDNEKQSKKNKFMSLGISLFAGSIVLLATTIVHAIVLILQLRCKKNKYL